MTAFICDQCSQSYDDGLEPEETARLELEAGVDDLEEFVSLCELCAEAFRIFMAQGAKRQ